MKIALAVVVRDEADVIEELLAYHLHAGVDLILATDHRSQDGTREILEAHERAGHVRLLREDGQRIRQRDWMTRMARLAATEHGATWVLNGDADEFWWPRGGSLPAVLGAVPARFAAVHALSQPFMLVPDDDRSFAERMTVRLSQPAPINDPLGAYRPVTKVAHRAHPNAIVGSGNHHVAGVPGAALRSWCPLEILHFPLRTRRQCEHKYRKTWLGWEQNLRGDLAFARTTDEGGRFQIMYERVVVSEEAMGRGLATGTLVRDTRLRDALRETRGGDTAAPASPLAERGRDENPAYPGESAVATQAELVRMQRRLDELSLSVARLELVG